MLGIEPRKGIFIDETHVTRFTEELSKKYNLAVDARAITGSLPVGVKQKIEILKTLARGAKIIILDEPTAVLTPQETDQLFLELKELKKMGCSIIFISHKIREVKQISDRITVLRKGKNAAVFNTNEVSEKEISSAIMGTEARMNISKEPAKPGDVGISVEGLTFYGGNQKPILSNINFCVRYGSILGIAGVQGNGQVELVQLLTKNLQMEQGQVEINKSNISDESIAALREKGYAYIPEDRMIQGVAMNGSITDNILANRYKQSPFSNRGWMFSQPATQMAKQHIADYEINAFGEKQCISMLSGGNIQKVVVGRECSVGPCVMIAEQPSRGIDIGAAYIVHKNLISLRDSGCAILLVSADLNELLGICDSLIVMYEGEIVAYFDDVQNITEEELGLCMLGANRHSQEQIERVCQ